MPYHKRRVEGAFNTFAEKYDGVAGKSMASFADLLVRDLQIPENPRVLDVGCARALRTPNNVFPQQSHGSPRCKSAIFSNPLLLLCFVAIKGPLEEPLRKERL